MTWQGEGLEAHFRPESSPAYHIEHLERNRPIVKKVIAYAQALGLDMIEGDYEDEFQVELNFMYDHADLTADRLVTYRQICKQVARELGIEASFMPKPATGMMGNGCHHNFSLWRDDVNILVDPGVHGAAPVRGGQARARRAAHPLGRRHAGQRLDGQLLQALLGRRPVRALEDQLGPGQQDVHGAAVGQRPARVQAPRRRGQPVPLARADDRGAGGRAEEHDRPRRADRRLVATRESRTPRFPPLPLTLGDAISAFDRDQVIKDAFGAELSRLLIDFHADEWARFCGYVTDWERSMYWDDTP